MPKIQRSTRDGKKFMIKFKGKNGREKTKHWGDSNGTIASSYGPKAKAFHARHDGKTLGSWLAKKTWPGPRRSAKKVGDTISIPSKFK